MLVSKAVPYLGWGLTFLTVWCLQRVIQSYKTEGMIVGPKPLSLTLFSHPTSLNGISLTSIYSRWHLTNIQQHKHQKCWCHFWWRPLIRLTHKTDLNDIIFSSMQYCQIIKSPGLSRWRKMNRRMYYFATRLLQCSTVQPPTNTEICCSHTN